MADATAKLERQRKRRQAVIDAAAAVFAEKGYHGASTRDIALRLGMQQGSLYYHFPSKESALEEVCQVGVAEFVDGLLRIVESGAPPAEKLRAAVANHLTPLRDKRDYVRVFLFERHHLPRNTRGEVAALSREYENLLERLFREGEAAGAFRRGLDAKMAVLSLNGMCNMAAARYRPGREPSLERLIDGLAELMLAAVRA
jgi:TetR/AcrR family transcriptional regulator, cholesterol catabolism regulator